MKRTFTKVNRIAIFSFFSKKSIILLTALISFPIVLHAQNLIHNFEFNGNLSDSRPTGVSLNTVNTASASFGTNPNSWSWTQPASPGGGLELFTNELPNPENYSVGFRISFQDTGNSDGTTKSYKKILTFKGANDDNGLYFNHRNLQFFPFGANSAITYLPNTFYDFVLTRTTADVIKIYIVQNNGTVTEVYSENDPSKFTVPVLVNGKYEFRFFINDPVGTEHTPGGTVRSIRVWDAPLASDEIAAALSTVTTGEFTNIGSSTVTLNGEVNPEGSNSTFRFDYGTTTSYGSTIATTPASGNGSSAIAVSANLTGLQPGITYHYRLKSTSGAGDSFGSDKTFTTLSAGGVPNSRLWLKANTGITTSGSNLTGWVDQAGINTFTVNGIVGYQTEALNFNPIVSFVNTIDVDQLPSNRLTGNAPITTVEAFAVFRWDGIASTNAGTLLGGTEIPTVGTYGKAIFGGSTLSSTNSFQSDGNGWSAYPTNSLFEQRFSLNNVNLSNPILQTRVDGKNVSPGPVEGSLFNSITLTPQIGGTTNNPIGGIKWNHFNGQIAELIAFSTALSVTERNKIESYLALKYGISLGNNTDSVAYNSSGGITIWPANTIYKYDIFGIGKDDVSALNQRSSNSINTGSGHGIGQSRKGNIVISSPSSLDNNDFLIIGHDNGLLTEQSTDLPSAEIGNKRLGREWKVKNTGDVGTIRLSFDMNGLCFRSTQPDQYKLIIDIDGNGDFTNGPITTVIPNSFSADILMFNGLTIPDNSVFTIVAVPSSITLTSALDTDNQTQCINSPITDITYLANNATIGSVTGLPPGVTSNLNSGVFTLSGTPTTSGTFNYTITTTGGCTTNVTATGTIVVTANNTVTTASSTPTLCINSLITPITHSSTGATGIGTAIDLPNGVTAVWKNNVITISGTPSNAGVFNYSIPLVGGCGLVTATGSINVTALPTKPVISVTGATSFCSPGSVVLNSSALTGNQWYKDGVAINGETTNAYSASTTGSYSLIITQNSCTSEISDPVVVTANPTPSFPIIKFSKSTTVCEGDSVKLFTSSTIGNKWFKDGAEIIGETKNSYLATVSGSYTVETTNPSGCISGVSAPIIVTVNPLPVVDAITGSTAVCSESTIQLTNTTSGGVWTSNNSGIATVDAKGLVKAIAVGSVIINYTVTNTGCATNVAKSISISEKPIQPIITATGATTFCTPDSVVLNSNSTSGNQWYKDGVAIIKAKDKTYTATESGSYTVIVSLGNCDSEISNSITIIANPIPVIDIITGNASVCSESSIQLNNLTPGGVWSSSNTSIASIDGTGLVNGIKAGAIIISYTVTNTTGCFASVNKDISIIAKPIKPSISSASTTTFCSPGSVVLSSNASTGNQWYKDGIAINGETANSYTASITGSFTLINTQNSCTSDISDPVVVTANPTPSIPIIKFSKSTTVCEGESVKLFTSSTIGNKWFKDGVEIIGETKDTYSATLSGSYTVETINPSGCVSGVSKPIIVTVNPLPIVEVITGNTIVCSESTTQLTNTTPRGIWNSNNTGIATVDATGFVKAITAGSVIISYTVTNIGCETTVTKSISITAKPIKPTITASSATTFCKPHSLELHSSSLNGNQWYKDGIAIAKAKNKTFTATESGSYTVIVTVDNCSSELSDPIAVTANPPPIIDIITGNDVVCSESSIQLNNTTSAGVWSSGNTGIAAIDGTGLVTAISAGSTTISYTVTNATGCFATVTKDISITAKPLKPTIIPSDATSFCLPGSVILNSSALTENQWFKDGIAIAGETANTYTANTSGDYTVLYTQNNCSSDISNPIVVTANAIPSIPILKFSKSTTVCEGESVKLFTSSTIGNKWFKDGVEITGETKNTYTATVSGSYTVETINPLGCVSGISTPIIVTVNPLPIVDAITFGGSPTICSESTVQLSNTTSSGVWSTDNPGIATVDAVGLVTGISAGTAIISYTVTNSSGCTTTVTSPIEVKIKPIKPIITASGAITFCSPGSVVLHSNFINGNKWYKDGIEIAKAKNKTFTAIASGTYTLIVTLDNCSSDISDPIIVIANPTPVIDIISGNTDVCSESSIQLTSLTPGGVWNSSNSAIAAIDATGLVNGITAGTVTISYTITNSTGCFSTVTKDINIKNKPLKPIISASNVTSICSSDSVILNSSALTGNQWYKDGNAITGEIGNAYSPISSGNYSVVNTQNNCTSEFSNSILINVYPIPMVGIINGNSTIKVNESIQYTNTTVGGNWSSDNTKIATITSAGIVKGISPGNVIISYTVTNSNGCTTTVTKAISVIPFALIANNDDYSSTPIDSSKGSDLDILANDLQNNGPIVISEIVVSIIDFDGLTGVTVDNQGKVNIPLGSPIGTYSLTYNICDVMNSSSCSSATITIVIKDPCDFDDNSSNCDLIVRNAVSPNNDGSNDVLFIEKIENYPDNTVEIFNRWGILVFKINGYNNTSNAFRGYSEEKGTIGNNKELPNGTYFYILKYKKAISGIVKEKAGYLYISR